MQKSKTTDFTGKRQRNESPLRSALSKDFPSAGTESMAHEKQTDQVSWGPVISSKDTLKRIKGGQPTERKSLQISVYSCLMSGVFLISF